MNYGVTLIYIFVLYMWQFLTKMWFLPHSLTADVVRILTYHTMDYGSAYQTITLPNTF